MSQRGGLIGGVEAARTAMGVLRHMYSWSIEEKKIKREDNPFSNTTKNLPKKKQGEIVPTLPEARIVYQAAANCGYLWGTQSQLQLLTCLRLDNVCNVRGQDPSAVDVTAVCAPA